jgi:hypothetical protein
MADLVNEVLEEQSLHHKIKLLKVALPVFVILCLAIVYYLITSDHKEQKDLKIWSEESYKLISALDKDEHVDIKQVDANFLSELKLLIKNNKLQEILDKSKNAVDDKNYLPLTRDIALLNVLSISLDLHINLDKKYLDLIVNTNSLIWQNLLLIKSLWLIKQKDFDSAKQALSLILADTQTPEEFKLNAISILKRI